jgi:hypothetical protein
MAKITIIKPIFIIKLVREFKVVLEAIHRKRKRTIAPYIRMQKMVTKRESKVPKVDSRISRKAILLTTAGK